MQVNKSKMIILLGLLLLFMGLGGFLVFGLLEYQNWFETKQMIAAGGYPNLYAGTLGVVTPACTPTAGGCSCELCNTCGCAGFTQATITMGQEVNRGATFLCVSDATPFKGTHVVSSAGRQFMAGSLTGQCLTANAIIATPGLAATKFERLADVFDKYIIAGLLGE